MKTPTLLAVARHRGTDSSNPFPSSAESGANLSLGLGRRRLFAAGRPSAALSR
jgi:hypothetical protein